MKVPEIAQKKLRNAKLMWWTFFNRFLKHVDAKSRILNLLFPSVDIWNLRNFKTARSDTEFHLFGFGDK